MSTEPRLTLRLARLLGLALVAVQTARLADERYFVDDAWISFRIARNLLTHGVLTFDVTQPPVEGETNLLWTLGSAVGQVILPGAEPGLVARLAGILCLGGLVWVATGLVHRLVGEEGGTGERPGLAALVTAAVLGMSGNLAFHSLGGLETGSYALLWALALDAAVGRPRPVRLGVVLVLLAMTRPEGVLLGALLLGAVLLGSPPTKGGRPYVSVGLYGVGVAAMEAFRWTTYGALVPNTFHAKPPDAGAGATYLLAFLGATGGIGALGALLAAERLRAWRAAVVIGAVLGVGAVWSGGDWMPGYRRFMDVYVVLAIGAGLAVGTSARRAAAWAAVVALLAGSATWTATGRDVGRYGSLVYGQVGQLLARTPGVDTVAAADIGRLGWYFPGAILDLGALTDARLTQGWDDAYVTSRDPDVLLVVASGAVPADLADPDGLRHFEAPALDWARQTGRYRVATVVPLPGGTVMSVLRRDDVAWPAEVWGP